MRRGGLRFANPPTRRFQPRFASPRLVPWGSSRSAAPTRIAMVGAISKARFRKPSRHYQCFPPRKRSLTRSSSSDSLTSNRMRASLKALSFPKRPMRPGCRIRHFLQHLARSNLIRWSISTAATTKHVYLCDTYAGIVKAGPQDSFFRGGELRNTSVELVKAWSQSSRCRMSQRCKASFRMTRRQRSPTGALRSVTSMSMSIVRPRKFSIGSGSV
jgi:hypothetical protein